MEKMKRTQGSGSKKKIVNIPEKEESDNEYSWDPDFD
jgi:hypothetical protein